jgi:hypothetical protein
MRADDDLPTLLLRARLAPIDGAAAGLQTADAAGGAGRELGRYG